MRLEPDGIDDRVRPASFRQVSDLVDDRIGEVVGEDAAVLRHGTALGDRLDGEHPIPPVHAGTGYELADGPQTQHGQSSAFGDLGVLHALPGCGQDVAEIQVPVVGELRPDTDVVVVGEGHSEVLRLPSGDLAVQLGVSEQGGAAAVLPHLRGLALRLQAAPAHEAVPAGDGEGNHHAVADGELRHLGADRHDFSHGLVAEDVAAIQERSQQLVQVKIGAADRRGRDADDGIRRLLDGGIRHFRDLHLARSLPGQCPHRDVPPSRRPCQHGAIGMCGVPG